MEQFDLLLDFINEYSQYFSLILISLCSFFISLPKDLDPIEALSLIFRQIAKKVNLEERTGSYKRVASILSVAIIYLPCAFLLHHLFIIVFNPLALEMTILFLLLSWNNKKIVYVQIQRALQLNKLPLARYKLASITYRDTKPLTEAGINKASIESMALHFAATWFTVMFWYLLTGIYGALFYRIVQVCAQQWNQKNSEFSTLSYLPHLVSTLMQLPVHLLLAFTFALYDKPIKNFVTKFKQAYHWHHFASGLMLSSFALGLHIELGGVRIYNQTKVIYTKLGLGKTPTINAQRQAMERIFLAALFWLICYTSYIFFPVILESVRY